MLKWMIELIPLFRTEVVAMKSRGGDDYEVVGLLDDLEKDEEYTHVMEVSSLCWLWQGFFPTSEGLIRKEDY